MLPNYGTMEKIPSHELFSLQEKKENHKCAGQAWPKRKCFLGERISPILCPDGEYHQFILEYIYTMVISLHWSFFLLLSFFLSDDSFGYTFQMERERALKSAGKNIAQYSVIFSKWS